MNHKKKIKYHFLAFSISKFSTSLGNNILTFGTSLYILAATGSALGFAINLICSILPKTLLAPVAGYCSDYYSRKKVVLISQFCTILTVLALYIYTVFNGFEVLAIYSATFILTSISTFNSVSYSASLANLFGTDYIQKVISLNQLIVSVSTIAGPILGGLLYGLFSFEIFLIINIFSYSISFLLETAMNFNLYRIQNNMNQVKENFVSSFKKGLTYVKEHPLLKAIVLITMWLNLFMASINVGGAYILVEILNISATNYGFIEASSAIGMLCISLFFALLNKKLKRPLFFSKFCILVLSILISLLGLPLVVEFSSNTGIVLFYTVLYFSLALLGVAANIPISTTLQNNVADEYKGRVFGLIESCAVVMMPLGTLVYGVLYNYFPAEWILIVSSAILILSTLYLFRKSVLTDIYPEGKKTSENHPSQAIDLH